MRRNCVALWSLFALAGSGFIAVADIHRCPIRGLGLFFVHASREDGKKISTIYIQVRFAHIIIEIVFDICKMYQMCVYCKDPRILQYGYV